MPRFYVPPAAVRGSSIVVDDPRELHHIRDVLRLRPGDPVRVFDGQGKEYTGIIFELTAEALRIRVDEVRDVPARRGALWLIQGVPKGDRFEWLLQKATELGVDRITPVITSRSVVRFSAAQAGPKVERWRRIVKEAAKQGGRAPRPAVAAPQPIADALPLLKGVPLILMPTLAVTVIPMAAVLAKLGPAARAAVLIGPEGDFTKDEVVLAESYGARPVSLGPLTLRSETAAIAVLSILGYVLDRE